MHEYSKNKMPQSLTIGAGAAATVDEGDDDDEQQIQDLPPMQELYGSFEGTPVQFGSDFSDIKNDIIDTENNSNVVVSVSEAKTDALERHSETNNVKKLEQCSPVWMCARKLTPDIAECIICKAVLATNRSSTSNITYHIIYSHPEDERVKEMQRKIIEKREKNQQSQNNSNVVVRVSETKTDALERHSETNNVTKQEQCSPVWMCARKLTPDIAECIICKAVLATKRSTTTNIIHHILNTHPEDERVKEMHRRFIEKKEKKTMHKRKHLENRQRHA